MSTQGLPTQGTCNLPVDIAYKILTETETAPAVYTSIASHLIPTTVLDSFENAALLVHSVRTNSLDRFSLLVSLGVPIVSVTRKTLMGIPASGSLSTVFSPAYSVSPAFAEKFLEEILCIKDDSLGILRTEIAASPVRLSLFERLPADSLIKLYIHVNCVPQTESRDVVLVPCARAGVLSPTKSERIRIQEIIAREDAITKEAEERAVEKATTEYKTEITALEVQLEEYKAKVTALEVELVEANADKETIMSVLKSAANLISKLQE